MVRETIRRADLADVFLSGLGFVFFGLAARTLLLEALGESGVDSPLVASLISVGFGIAFFWTVHRCIRPEYNEVCAVCGDEIVVDSATDGFDSALLVRTSDTPNRLTLGPLSVIRRRDKDEETVCSGDCAERWVSEFQHYKDLRNAHREVPVTDPSEVQDGPQRNSEVSD
jgi:hypothetical protein